MMPMPDPLTAALQRAAARDAEHTADLERQLAEAIARAEFAEDQCEVAIKDRDLAERQLAATRDALGEAALQIRYLHEKFRETGSGNSVLARIDAALQNGS